MAAKLVDLKYTKAEVKAEAAEYSSPKDGGPEYPWGLEIRLEDEELSKLGITGLPDVGGEYHLSVVAKVKSASQTSMANGKTDRCVCLQITMIGIDLAESADEEKGEKDTPAAESAETKKASRSGLMGKY